MILFYDTETTGLPPKNAGPLEQPRLVQFGCILSDEEGNELSSIDVLVRPDGFDIPDEASRVHGVVTGMARTYGVPVRSVLNMFLALRNASDLIIGHNVEFDENIMFGEYTRIGVDFATVPKEKVQCTALLAEPIIKIPPTARMKQFGYGPYKKPNLMEAHTHFLGEGFVGAHSALADVRACKRVYFAMKEQGFA